MSGTALRQNLLPASDAAMLPSPQAPRIYLWYVVGLMSVVNLFNYLDRMALSVLMPSIKADLQLTDSQLGLLVGLAFAIFYGLCGIPIARLADHAVRKRIIATAICVWSLMTALCGAAQSYWQLFLARVGVGAGEAGCLPPSQSMMSDYFPAHQRPMVFAVMSIGLFLGMMCGVMITGHLEQAFGWRWAFVLVGLPGLLLGLIVALTLREPRRGYYDPSLTETGAARSLRETLRVLFSRRSYRLLAVYQISIGFAQYGIPQWLPSFYQRVFAADPHYVATWLGLAIGVGSMTGLALGGWAALHLARANPGHPMRLGALATAFALAAAGVVLSASSAAISIASVALMCAFWHVSTGAFLSAIQGQAPQRMRATASAVLILLNALIGYGLGPFSVGILSDALSAQFGDQTLRFALIGPLATFPSAIWSLWALGRSLDEDRRSSNSNGGAA